MWAVFALPALLPWFMRARQAARMAKNWSRMSGPRLAKPRRRQVKRLKLKQYLKMYLDHDSGEMNGDVVLGQFLERR